jgi:hypothetical protein
LVDTQILWVITGCGLSQVLLWQQNLCKSNDVQQDWLVAMGKRQILISLAQEPYIDFVRNSRTNQTWLSLYPTVHWRQPSRTRFYIVIYCSLPWDRWEQIDVDLPNVTAVHIKDKRGDLYIFNIYNNQKHSDTLHAMDRTISAIWRTRHDQQQLYYFIWAGNFNQHSPLWDEDRNHHLFTQPNLNMAQILINLVTKHRMAMALPSGIPMLCAMATKNYMCPDNIFLSELLIDRCVKCTVEDHEQPPKTDHILIQLVLEYNLELKSVVPQRNWVMVEWEDFRATLEDSLANKSCPEIIRTTAEFDSALDNLDIAIKAAIKENVPTTNYHKIYLKHWWSKDLDKMQKTMRRQGCKARQLRMYLDHQAHEEYWQAQNRYSEAIQQAKEKCWKQC